VLEIVALLLDKLDCAGALEPSDVEELSVWVPLFSLPLLAPASPAVPAEFAFCAK
jgi:hypothetical protein